MIRGRGCVVLLFMVHRWHAHAHARYAQLHSFPGFPSSRRLEPDRQRHYSAQSADAVMGLTFYKMKVLVLFLLLSAAPMVVLSTQLEGTINSGSHFVKYLAKFGVKEGRSVFMFGTAERKGNRYVSFHSLMTLAFVPDGVWNHFYHDASKHHHVCQDIMNDTLFSRTTTSDCIGGTQDYLRMLPCDSNKCINQPNDVELISGEKFTYRLLPTRTEFYYVFLVACTRNANQTQNCYWESSDDVEIEYDIHIVNSDPDVVLRPNPFVYEFSYDLQNLLLIFMTFTFCYYAMLIFHILINCTSTGLRIHRLVIIFTVSLILEAVYVSFELIHYAVYAHDGMGVVALKYLGEVANQVSDWLFILVFILIAKGWQLTIATIRWKKVTFLIWGIYIAFSAIYFMWLVVSLNNGETPPTPPPPPPLQTDFGSTCRERGN